MKEIVIKFVIPAVLAVVCYALLWVVAGTGALGEIGFGYYGDFNKAKRAIEESGCVESLDYGLHKDITLENFHFTIRTKSGWKIGLQFIYEMNAGQVCKYPRGILVDNPIKSGWQVYDLNYLSNLLRAKKIRLNDIGDVLCNLDELVPVFEANYENENIPTTDRLTDRFLRYIVFVSVPWNNRSIEAARKRQISQMITRQDIVPGELRNFEFDVASLDSTGNVINRRRGMARSYFEDIGSGVLLEMVEIPGGKFLMGISAVESEQVLAEYRRLYSNNFGSWHADEVEAQGPRHPVTLPKFYMGKFEVTQAQWRAVTALPKVRLDLPGNRSEIKGDDLPVESVSWEEAVEFCERLSRATGREYRLPTEAEWEYACRAGTTTSFHFGDTITPEFVNYSGRSPYGKARWGIDRDEVIPVGVLGVANAFGLYDMHGNVEEWCLDPWHKNYFGAPSDGSVWMTDGDDKYRVVRGGSYFSSALHCLSTNRDYGKSNEWGRGFRVVAVARNQ